MPDLLSYLFERDRGNLRGQLHHVYSLVTSSPTSLESRPPPFAVVMDLLHFSKVM
jgi:hypothetical protein